MPATSFQHLPDFARRPDPEPAAPMVSLSEADAMAARARAQGFAEGAAEGQVRALAEADETVAAQSLAVIRQIAQRVDALSVREDEILTRLEVHATRLVLSVVQRLASGIAEAEAERAARNVAARVVSQLRRRSHLQVVASPEIAKTVETLFEDATHGMPDPPMVTITADPDLPNSTFTADWQTGAMTFDLAPATEAVDAIIAEATADLHSHDPDKED